MAYIAWIAYNVHIAYTLYIACILYSVYPVYSGHTACNVLKVNLLKHFKYAPKQLQVYANKCKQITNSFM